MHGRAKILADIINVAYKKLQWTDEGDSREGEGLMGKIHAVQITIMCEHGNKYIHIGAAQAIAHIANVKVLSRGLQDSLMKHEMK
jgi:hypothetical protein